MKKYTVGMVRERLAQALDEAQRGEPVFVERKGVLYRLSVEKPVKTGWPRQSYLDVLDPAVEAGQWTWEWSSDTLRFRSRLKSRRTR